MKLVYISRDEEKWYVLTDYSDDDDDDTLSARAS